MELRGLDLGWGIGGPSLTIQDRGLKVNLHCVL